ncbi:MotA/TolQ/ExbB proton channel family protein [Natribacillus halophilus]|uniref:Chemotaxis protein MotA n=1 Tax=Natribacillus halophilus TaxID=549003 RepID=A0A1G8NFG0_9BACI|nr:MotA/TolQ/ExbB proton channel family protein [Natribacillus halophilus]SDI78827.1 chemotaxis protein MotA [Natribacillus halophilus]
MKKLDMLTPVGLILGLVVVGSAIYLNAGTDAVILFMQLASVFIVFGGVAAALLVNFSGKELMRLPTIVKQGFRRHEYDLQALSETFVMLSKKARKEGLLALEPQLDEDVEDPFIRKGVRLAVDGLEPEMIKDILMAEVVSMEERHRRGRRVIERAGDYAPAWGMVGTLVALVIMLNDLDDPATLGPSMALAMLTTLYGVILASLFCNPLAGKLENKTETEAFVNQIMIEGVIGVQSGQNPQILEEKLRAFIREKRKPEYEVAQETAAFVSQGP